MLENSFYHITSFEHDNGVVTAGLSFNTAHAIFNGHFPGQPVVPGACMLQMEKELLEKAIGRTVQLEKAINIKYISHITPEIVCAMRIQYTLKDDGIDVAGVITANGQPCYKSKIKYSALS
jgi:3-hydroxyacyl-[acyl-carrier-protein] dehydratase